MPGRNAIEQRLDIIEEQWFAFTANPDARLARWRLDGDGVQLVEVFLEAQTVEDSAVPDFIMRLAVPFTDATRYGHALRAAFIAEIEAGADEMREAGIDPAWPVPPERNDISDVAQFLITIEAFRRHYADLFERLVVVLMPDEVADARLWAWWLEQLLHSRLPEPLRFMVFDRAEVPLLDAFASQYAGLVMTLSPELDMPGAIDSLVRSVGGSGPADVFRRMFVGMNTSAMRGNVAGALALGASASAVAQKQGWVQQVAVVHMAVGGILMSAGRLAEALKAFRASGDASKQSRDQGDPGSDKVVIHAKLAEAGALVSAQAWPEAAATYEEAVKLVAEAPQPDPVLLLESRRMAAYCHEQAGRPDMAWLQLGHVLVDAKGIEAEQRLTTTLPFAVQSLMRICEHPHYQPHRPLIESRLVELIGPDWHARVQEKLPA